MPTVMTHAVIGWGLARVCRRPDAPRAARAREFLAAGLACLPDADVIAFRLGIPYGDPWGHRGMSHSLLAAVVTALAAWLLLRWLSARESPPGPPDDPAPAGPPAEGGGLGRPSRFGGPALDLVVLVLAAASHGVLDMFTNGGHGVALLAPFDHQRVFWPVRPVPVSPIGVAGFFARGLPVFLWELVLMWPVAALGFLPEQPRSARAKLVAAGVLLSLAGVAWGTRLA